MTFSPDTTAGLLNSLADIVIQLDTSGVILALDVNRADAVELRQIRWQGRTLADVVTEAHRVRVQQTLDWCRAHPDQTTIVLLSHPLDDGTEPVTVRYALRFCTTESAVVGVGQDKGELTEAKQQLVNAQLAMERDYWSLRQTEIRYRQLLDMAHEGFVVLDDASHRILELNGAAAVLLGHADQAIVGQAFPPSADDDARNQFSQLIDTARTTGSAAGSVGGIPSSDGQLRVQIDYLSQRTGPVLLIRLTPVHEGINPEALLRADFDQMPDAVLQLDSNGLVTGTNNVFLDWVQEPSERAILGRSADHWLGRTGVDTQVLLDNLSQRGNITRYASTLRTRVGVRSDVEISASTQKRGGRREYLLFLRDTSRRIQRDDPVTSSLPASIEQITRRVGQTTLKELVRESTDVIEALCIEAALKLTRNNRASAAELLGLSRQSLYTKLRRFGIGEPEDD